MYKVLGIFIIIFAAILGLGVLGFGGVNQLIAGLTDNEPSDYIWGAIRALLALPVFIWGSIIGFAIAMADD